MRRLIMQIAVLSDIHANIEAFQAVFRDLEHRVDGILNLGDLVGYNASPNECVEMARDISMHSIQGNHDQAACTPSIAENFNIYARNAILWTNKKLTRENILFLSNLEKNLQLPCGLACHGSPESTNRYIDLHFQAKSILKSMKKEFWNKGNICLFGHTHKRKVWQMDIRGKVAPIEIPSNGMVELNEEDFYLLNPGSVGQPRNGDARSSYLIFDTVENTARFRLVNYDIPSAMKRIKEADLPEFLAKRLMYGT